MGHGVLEQRRRRARGRPPAAASPGTKATTNSGESSNCCQYAFFASASTWARSWRAWLDEVGLTGAPRRWRRWRRGRPGAAPWRRPPPAWPRAGARPCRVGAARRRRRRSPARSKSQCSTMPAISTTRRSCISPHRPRVAGERSAVTRLRVSAWSRSWDSVSWPHLLAAGPCRPSGARARGAAAPARSGRAARAAGTSSCSMACLRCSRSPGRHLVRLLEARVGQLQELGVVVLERPASTARRTRPRAGAAPRRRPASRSAAARRSWSSAASSRATSARRASVQRRRCAPPGPSPPRVDDRADDTASATTAPTTAPTTRPTTSPVSMGRAYRGGVSLPGDRRALPRPGGTGRPQARG